MLGCLVPYLQINGANTVMVCPNATNDGYPSGYAPTATSNTSYDANGAIAGIKINQISNTSSIVFLQEDTFAFNMAFYRPERASGSNPPYFYAWHYNWREVPGDDEYSTQHFGGGNLLFGDGHAEWRTDSSLRASDFGLAGSSSIGDSGAATDTPTTSYDYNRSYIAQF